MACYVLLRPAEQVLEPLCAHESSPFEVEENVSGRRSWQERQAATTFAWQQLVTGGFLPTAFELHSCLLPAGLVDLDRATPGAVRNRNRQLGEGCKRINAPIADLPLMKPAQTRHEAEMIILSASAAAGNLPTADVTMRHRLRVGSWSIRLDIRFNGLLDLAAHQPVVRQVVLDTKNFSNKRLHRIRTGRHHMHALRERPLNLLHHVGVQTELQNRSGFGLPRKFGVYHFIDPVAKLAAALDSAQNICSARPSPTSKGCLYDDIRASAHGLCRSRPGTGRPLHREIRAAKLLDVRMFVLEAALSHRLEFRQLPVVARRSWDAAQCLVEVQAGEMAAGQVGRLRIRAAWAIHPRRLK